MARPSKRRQQAVVSAKPVVAEQFTVIHKTAIYARLSREDNLNKSDSIENQLAFLHDYVDNRPYLQLTGTFVDNGYTGTDFERPEWQKLMEAVQAKEIDCIVVKDLSRLGRNYIETSVLSSVFALLQLMMVSILQQPKPADSFPCPFPISSMTTTPRIFPVKFPLPSEARWKTANTSVPGKSTDT